MSLTTPSYLSAFFTASGLGMRVMFGKKGHGGKLGAFVSKVERNGPADSYGIRKGKTGINTQAPFYQKDYYKHRGPCVHLIQYMVSCIMLRANQMSMLGMMDTRNPSSSYYKTISNTGTFNGYYWMKY